MINFEYEHTKILKSIAGNILGFEKKSTYSLEYFIII